MIAEVKTINTVFEYTNHKSHNNKNKKREDKNLPLIAY